MKRGYLPSLFPGMTALTPAATMSTVVPTVLAPTLTAVEATVTTASATATTAHPPQTAQTDARPSNKILWIMVEDDTSSRRDSLVRLPSAQGNRMNATVLDSSK